MPPFDDARGLGRFAAEVTRQVAEHFGGNAPRSIRDTSRTDLKRELGARLRDFARTFGYEIYVPGTHAGGIGNQELFDLLAARGWEWGADTRRLRDYVRIALLNEFEDGERVPLQLEIEQVTAGAVLEWVARRLDGNVTDVPRPALSAAYAKQKRRRFSRGRAGTASGELAEAIRERGRLTFT